MNDVLRHLVEVLLFQGLNKGTKIEKVLKSLAELGIYEDDVVGPMLYYLFENHCDLCVQELTKLSLVPDILEESNCGSGRELWRV